MSGSVLTELSRSPRLYVADGFVPPADIDHILARADRVEHGRDEDIRTKHDYTGFSFEMPVDGDAVTERFAVSTADVLGVENAVGGTLRFRRYRIDEYHPPHMYCYRIGDLYLVATALLYLTDTVEGGETVFPRARPRPLTVTPKRGRLAAWFNHYPNGAEDPAAWHASEPVRRGEKATITSFVYATRDRCTGAVRVGA